MSATREILCEKIEILEKQLEDAIVLRCTERCRLIELELLELKKQLTAVNKVLNEGSIILKG